MSSNLSGGPLFGDIRIINTHLPKATKSVSTIVDENKSIRFATPDLTKTEKAEVSKAIDTRWITKGPAVRKFEKKVAEISRCDRAVAYDSCTGAMEMTLRALGIGRGDEVITTPYTYTATAEVIRSAGAKIVFIDILDSFQINVDKLRAAITEKTKAVMPVDIGGKLCDYDSLIAALDSKSDIFKPKNSIQKAIGRVAVIADAAHSFGATSKGKVSGEHADFTCFSFHVLKNITTGGEGGAVVWKDIPGIDNDELEEKLRLLGDHGQTSRDKSTGWEYDIALFGYNSIMTDVDASMGLAQLGRLSEINSKREAVTRTYDRLFEGSSVVPLIKHIGKDYRSSMHLYPIRLPVEGEEGRNYIFKALQDMGVPCNVHYKPLPMMTAYKKAGFSIDDYPNAYKIFSTLLTIPYHSELTEKEQEYIVNCIEKAVKSYVSEVKSE